MKWSEKWYIFIPMTVSSTSTLSLLHQLNTRFLRMLTREQTYRLIVQSAVKLVNAHTGSLFIYRNRRFVRVYSSIPKHLQVEPRPRGDMYTAYTSKKIKFLGMDRFKRNHPEFKDNTVKAQLLVPLIYQNKTAGILNLSFIKKSKLSPKQIEEVLLLFGATASLAMRKSQLSENIRLSLKNRDMFISMAAHELRTPLTTIRGCIDIIKKKVSKNVLPPARMVELVAEESARMTKLVNELLVVEQIDSGRFQYEWQPINLKNIIAKILTESGIVYPNRKIIFVDKSLTKKLTIIGDENKIYQVLSNILHNAIKFSQDSSVVNIVLRNDSDYVIIDIEDQGIGVSQKDLQHIFEGFYKATDNTRGGMGLGLYVAKRVVDSHKGRIEVTSSPNKGTKVSVYLPIFEKNNAGS